MFPVFTSSAVLRIYQIRYCEGRFNECKRFESASQGVMPPPTLLPDGDLLEPAADTSRGRGSGS